MSACTGERFELFLDGQPVRSSAFTVPVGRHVLALHTPTSNFLLLAVQKNSEELLLRSEADGTWLGTNQSPPPNWAQPDFAADWPALAQVARKDEDWRLKEMGAKPPPPLSGRQRPRASRPYAQLRTIQPGAAQPAG